MSGEPHNVRTCPGGKIVNPDSGRCVNISGRIGRKILAKISEDVRQQDRRITRLYDGLVEDSTSWTREFSKLFMIFRQLKHLDTTAFERAHDELQQSLGDIGYGEGHDDTADQRLYNEVFEEGEEEKHEGNHTSTNEPGTDPCEGKSYREVQTLVRAARSCLREIHLNRKRTLLCQWLRDQSDRNDILRNLSIINRLDREMCERKIDVDPNWINDVPNDAILQLSDVRPLYHARHNQNNTSQPESLYVIEPQAYDSIALLDSNSFMFSESNSELRDTDRVKYVGFFFGDEHATSGSGSDPWFKCNYAFAQFLSQHIQVQQERISAYDSVPIERDEERAAC